jgi:anti-sigma factor RsiW
MLADYLGDELGAGDRETFEAHLAVCENCRVEVEALQAALNALRELGPAPAVAPSPAAGHLPIVRLGLRRLVLRPLAYAATLLIGVGLGWMARPSLEAQVPHRPPMAEPRAALVPIEQQIRADSLPPVVRNAIALSTAFSRPVGE